MKTICSLRSCLVVFVLLLIGAVYGYAQEEKPLTYSNSLKIRVQNGHLLDRNSEPVVISLDTLKKHAPNFNPDFYRVKRISGGFEPRDIPSQIRQTAGSPEKKELVFPVTIAPGRNLDLEIQYNPTGSGNPSYPAKTQSFEKWYTGGINTAWENELIAYRSYNGIVDFFAKAYPHLRLHDLPPDSYHHESVWGLDPYVVGNKPGIGGVILFNGDKEIACYGGGEDSPNAYTHNAIDAGPVSGGSKVEVSRNGVTLISTHYQLHDGRYDNEVIIETATAGPDSSILAAPGLERFDNATISLNVEEGYILAFGKPLEEYGVIGTALIWNTGNFMGYEDKDGGIFIKLIPVDGKVRYGSTAVWFRASSVYKGSQGEFEEYVMNLARCFNNPLTVKFMDR